LWGFPYAIKSEIRLIHESTGAALKFSGRQLPDWGFNQHEVVADREKAGHQDTIWNVEEHRYTQSKIKYIFRKIKYILMFFIPLQLRTIVRGSARC